MKLWIWVPTIIVCLSMHTIFAKAGDFEFSDDWYSPKDHYKVYCDGLFPNDPCFGDYNGCLKEPNRFPSHLPRSNLITKMQDFANVSTVSLSVQSDNGCCQLRPVCWKRFETWLHLRECCMVGNLLIWKAVAAIVCGNTKVNE